MLIPTAEECFDNNLFKGSPRRNIQNLPVATFYLSSKCSSLFGERKLLWLTSNDTDHLLTWHASHTGGGLFFFILYYVSCFPGM